MAKVSGRSGGIKKTGGSSKAAKTSGKKKAAAQQKAKPRSDRFAGTATYQAERPAAELPRSGWRSAQDFARAARGARDAIGADGVATRPIIRPLYGLPVPVPIDVNVKDKDIAKWAKTALGDRTISLAEVKQLIDIAKDNGGISKAEKKDLKRLMDQAGHLFDLDALRELDKHVKDNPGVDRPPIRPLYGLPVPVPLIDVGDRELKDALPAMLRDRKISLDEVNKLIDVANDNGGVTADERRDLERIYNEGGEFLDLDAAMRLGRFLGLVPGPVPLYGLPVPVPFDDRLKDKKLDEALKPMLRDRKISLAEVNKLIELADDGRGLSRTERDDLQKLIDKAGQFFEPAARDRLNQYLGHGPPIRPLYGLPFPFPGPMVSTMGPMGMQPGVRPASSRPTVEEAHAKKFVEIAKSNGGLDAMEQSELRMLLSGGATFTPAARALMTTYLASIV